MSNPLNRRNFLKVAANASSCFALAPSQGLMAVSSKSPQHRAKSHLDLVIMNCVKPRHSSQSEKERVDALYVTIDVVEHFFGKYPQVSCTRLDLEMFAILFKQAFPAPSIILNPMEQLFIAAAFRRSTWVSEVGVGDTDSLKEYDEYLTKEVQRLVPREVSAKLDESMLLADAHDHDPAIRRLFNDSILSNTVRTLKDHGMPLGPRAQQVLWRDEEDENQRRWEEAFPGYWQANWTKEEF